MKIREIHKTDLTVYIPYAKYIANQRHSGKENYYKRQPATDTEENDMIGALGEIVYMIQVGENFDHRTLKGGDGGKDFSDGVQVKASLEGKAKWIILFPDESKAEMYVFVMINLKEKKGYLHSWISGEELLDKAITKDFGYGDRIALELEKLNPYYTYPPLVKSAINNIHKNNLLVADYMKEIQ